MGLVTKITLQDQDRQATDVQLWSSANSLSTPEAVSALSSLQFSRIGKNVDYRGVPIYLLQGPPLDVYSNSTETSNFFKKHLILPSLQVNENVGLLFGDDLAKLYLVFYFDLTIKALVLDFSTITTVMAYVENDADNAPFNYFLNFNEPVRRDSTNMTVFDKVLNKKKRPSPFGENPGLLTDRTSLDIDRNTNSDQNGFAADKSSPFNDPLSHPVRSSSFSNSISRSSTNSNSFALPNSSRSNSNSFALPNSSFNPSHSRTSNIVSLTLTSQEQINLAINKLILSGLRIRGLSTNLNHSINDKLTIKEIYNMTHKSALFSLRKFNYNFTGKGDNKGRAIGFGDLQDTVEKLLDLYVDTEPQ